MNRYDSKIQVFISDSSIDTSVAKQIALQIENCGARFFLDEADIHHGDNFEEKIIQAAHASSELLVLLTPWSTTRPYIWLEVGIFWGNHKRIVGVLHGLKTNELAMDERIPILLKRTHLLDINEIDSYFGQLRQRVHEGRVDL